MKVVALLALMLSLLPTPVHADDSACNNFETLQSVIISEATRQPFEAQLEIARVMVTHGACNIDRNFLAGYGVALDAEARSARDNHHWRSYFDLYSFSPDVRESAARAAHAALTEQPRVARYHFDRFDSRAAFWVSPRSCPNGV